MSTVTMAFPHTQRPEAAPQDAAGEQALHLARGRARLAALNEVTEERAPAEVRVVFTDIRATLRVPLVNTVFRALATWPGALALAWGTAAPYLRSAEAEREANALREAAVPPRVPEGVPPNVPPGAEGERVEAFRDTVHHVLPYLLLATEAMDAGLAGAGAGVAGSGIGHGRDTGTSVVEGGVLPGAVTVPLVDPAHAAPEVRALLEDVRDRHGHPVVASWYRGIANWPKHLAAVWGGLRPVVGTVPYHARSAALQEQSAKAVMRAGPLGAGAAPGRARAPAAGDPVLAEARDVLAVFRHRMIPDLMQDVTLVQAWRHGPEEAGSSRLLRVPGPGRGAARASPT